MTSSVEIYRHIASVEPLLPSAGDGMLAELSVEIFQKSGELKVALPSPAVRAQVAKLVREMNSYYSNLIEGHKTLPRDIEKALKDEFSDRPDDRRNQQLSVAHVKTEEAMRERLAAEPETDVYNSEFICWLHGQFYSHLPQSEWFTTSEDGKRYPIVPGEFRDYNVTVGRHIPPDHPTLPAFAARFGEFYSDGDLVATKRLVALAAAHHRLAWIHPFGDGNGRVARLQSQAAMVRAGLDSEGLWTLSRGLARSRQDYHRLLQAADQHRRNDFDGRGNLSDRALSEFCKLFLRQTLDQIGFMAALIAPFDLQDRIENYFHFARTDLDRKLRERFARLLKHLCLSGPIARGEVASVLGVKGTTARDVIRRALDEEFVRSPSPKGELGIAFPNKVVEYFFPQLFTDLAVDG